MKKTCSLFFALSLYLTSFAHDTSEIKYYHMTSDLSKDVYINKLCKGVKGEESFSSFEIEVPKAGDYFINFWLCPARYSNGAYSAYYVRKGNTDIGRIVAKKGDWQSISLNGTKQIHLEKGIFTISIVGGLGDIPNVEFLRLSTNPEEAKIDAKAYEEYKREITRLSHLQAEDNIKNFSEIVDSVNKNDARKLEDFPLPAQNTPPYDAKFMIGAVYKYTFYKNVYFTQGQNITLSTTGIDNFGHVLEFFKKNSPASYSWSEKSDISCQTSINITIPESGMYTVRVRSFQNARSGLCNLNINDETFHDSIPLYSNGIRGEKDIENIYNSFTCYKSSDPMLFVEEGGVPGHITAYNDDYISNNSDFYWGFNSRVRKRYTDTSNAILISCYTSYSPTGNCDLYANCLEAYTDISDNFLQSAPSTVATIPTYSCASWAGGIYTHYFWPPNVFVNQGLSELETFDRFFSTERYPGCSIFTRQYATALSSSIDLWATYSADSTLLYQHTSVKKGADTNAHGFDWESKLGTLNRIYHPRNHVPFEGYGHVVAHYLKVDTGTQSISLEEAIANGTAAVENVLFTKEESNFIEMQVRSIDPEVLSTFYSLLKSWQNVWDSTPLSNPDAIADCDEYRELLSFCAKDEKMNYAVFDYLGKGNLCASCLVKDLTLKENVTLLEKVWEKNKQNEYTEKGAQIIRTIQSNAMLYVKELLKNQMESLGKRRNYSDATGISYSNTDDFIIHSTGNGIVLIFSLNKTALVYADVIDLKGDIMAKIIKGTSSLLPDSYMFHANLPKGIYMVRYIVDGNTNVKKVRVE